MGKKTSAKIEVGIVLGSASDLETVVESEKVLKEFGVPYWLTVASAHRTPERVRRFVSDAEKAGARLFIAAAGMAAALPGVVASETMRPVIGVPIEGGSLKGLDALLSIVQMPGGMPVACMALGSAGARNAGLLAVQILALESASLTRKFAEHRKKQAGKVKESAVKAALARGGAKEFYLG